MSIDIDWQGMIKAIIKAIIPFLSGAFGGLLAGCSVYGTGAGVTF